jgi:hypothetical protein
MSHIVFLLGNKYVNWYSVKKQTVDFHGYKHKKETKRRRPGMRQIFRFIEFQPPKAFNNCNYKQLTISMLLNLVWLLKGPQAECGCVYL